MRRFLQTLACDLLASSSRRRTAARRGAMVFCLHGVNDRFDPAGYRSSHLHLDVFERIMDELGEVFRFVSLDDALGGGVTSDRPAAVLTFDDGYRDHLTHVAPALRKRAVPATFYVPATDLDDSRPPWFDRARLSPTCTQVDRLRRARPETIAAALDAVGDETSVPSGSHLRTLDGDGLRELASDPLFTIASHAVHHVDLAGQDEELQRSELVDSKRALEEVLGAPVDHLAYPSGSYDARTPELAQEAGYRSAATTDRAWMTERSDPFRLPRLIVGIGRASYCFYKAARLP